jgi:acyl-CoA thioester hydrolase
MAEPFRFPVRVYYEDTDAGGVVYHANYLRFAERARTEFLRAIGVEQRELRERDGLGFVVRRCTVDYRAPARLDDALDVVTTIKAIRGAALDAVQEIRRSGEDEALVVLDLVIACVNAGGRPARLPARVRDLIGRVAEPA